MYLNKSAFGELSVESYNTRLEMGRAAAEAVAAEIKRVAAEKGEVNLILAAAPSQNEFQQQLREMDCPWKLVNAYHLDEYIGLKKEALQLFSNFLKRNFTLHIPLNNFHEINGNAADSEAECQRYAEMLCRQPIDIACIGIGENGHIAFNDPPVADFNDPQAVKIVELDDICRRQQVNDGCFESLDLVPKKAITVTIPIIAAAKRIYCIVPGATKAAAVKDMLKGEITAACPASILRTLSQATLYLDKDSAGKL